MALLKKIQYPNGTETNYHKIGEIRIVPLADQTILVPIEPETPEVVEEIVPAEASTEPANTEAVAEGEVEPATPEEPEKPEEPEIEYEEVVVKTVSIMVQILSYVSQEIRETGANNNLTGQLQYFTVDMETLVSTDIMALCYNLIKTLPQFEDAEDI